MKKRTARFRRAVVLGLLACGLLASPRAHATHIPPYKMVVGPSTAWMHFAGSDHLVLGGDVTLSYAAVWGSVGTRATVDGPRFVAPYVELGAWFWANLGLGYSLAIRPGGVSHLVHAFIGAPIPITLSPTYDRCLIVVEPYYRPSLLVAGGPLSVAHEVGLLTKLLIWF